MTDDASTKGGTLVQIQLVAGKFPASHPTDGVDEIVAVQVVEPILVRIVGVRTTIEVICWRILPTFLITCILQTHSAHVPDELGKHLHDGSPR